jgi:hypothetical protein
MVITLSGSGFAADDEALVTLDISPKTVRVGDIITLDIFIKHKSGFSLYLPDSIDLTPFDIIGTDVKPMKKEGGTFSHATFKVAIYKVGVFSIPNINFLLKSDVERIEVATPERKLEVVSTLKGSGNALLDIYPPVDIRQSYLQFLVYVWVISFLLIVFTVIHFRKKKKQARLAALKAKPKPKKDPRKAANALLQKIFAGSMLKKLTDKEICENVSFTVKYFLREKFEIDALEMTSYELLKLLEDMRIDNDYLATLYKLLLKCDLVKFANEPLTRDTKFSDVGKLKDSALILLQA